MRGYGQFCPVALGAAVFAERWTPLILRELLAGSHRFSQLQRGLPGIPRALLAQRLGSLQRAGLIERRPARAGRGFEYHLSPAGASFRPVVEALGRWGYQWAAEQLRPDNLDAGLLMWSCAACRSTGCRPTGQEGVGAGWPTNWPMVEASLSGWVSGAR